LTLHIKIEAAGYFESLFPVVFLLDVTVFPIKCTVFKVAVRGVWTGLGEFDISALLWLVLIL
jgi:hypothetical protein